MKMIELGNLTLIKDIFNENNRRCIVPLCVSGISLMLFTWFHVYPSVIIPGIPGSSIWIYCSHFQLITFIVFGIIWFLTLSTLYSLWISKLSGKTFSQVFEIDSRTYLPLTLLYLDFFRFQYLIVSFPKILACLSILLVLRRKWLLLKELGIDPYQFFPYGKNFPSLTSYLKFFIAKPWTLFLFSLLTFSFFSSNMVFPLFPLTGDEPSYLVITDSLVFDNDLDVYNNFRINKHIQRFYKGKVELFTHIGRNKKHYPHHGVGLPCILFPFYYLGWDLPDTWFVFILRIPLLLMSSLLVLLIHKTILNVVKDPGVSLFFCLVLVFSTPLLFYSRLFYPEIPVALLTIYIIDKIITSKNYRLSTFIIFGIVLGVFPWFGIKYLALCAGLFLSLLLKLFFLNQLKTRNLLVFFVPLLILITIFLGFQNYFYGNLNLVDKYTTRLPAGELKTLHEHPSFSSALKVLPFLVKRAIPRIMGYFLDQRHGLVIYSPIFLLALIGLFHQFKLDKKLTIYLIIPSLFHLGLYSLYGSWGGYTPPTRPLIAILPIVSLFCSRGIKETIKRNGYELLIVLIAITAWLTYYLLKNPGWLYHDTKIVASNARSHLLTWFSSPFLDLTTYFPSFFGPWQNWNWLSNSAWIIMVTLSTFYWLTRKPTEITDIPPIMISAQTMPWLPKLLVLLLITPVLFVYVITLPLKNTDFSALLQNRIFTPGIAGAYYFNKRWKGTPKFIILEKMPGLNKQHWSQFYSTDKGLSIKWNGYLLPFLEGKYRVRRFPAGRFAETSIDNKLVHFNLGTFDQADIQLEPRFMHIQVLYTVTTIKGVRGAITWEIPGILQQCTPPFYFVNDKALVTSAQKNSYFLEQGEYLENIGAWKLALYLYKQVDSPRFQLHKNMKIRNMYNRLLQANTIPIAHLGKWQKRVFKDQDLRTVNGLRINEKDPTSLSAITNSVDIHKPGVMVFTPPKQFPEGYYKLLFRIKIGNNEISKPVAYIETIDLNYGILSKKILVGTDFKNQDIYQEFELEFYNIDHTSPVQFAVYTYALTNITLNKITQFPTNPQYAPSKIGSKTN